MADANLLHLKNARYPILCTLDGIVIDAKLVQSSKVPCDIVERGVAPVIPVDVKLVQPLNAFIPILVTDAGIVMDGKLVQPSNVDPAIVTRTVVPVRSTDAKFVAFTKFSIVVTVDATTTLSI